MMDGEHAVLIVTCIIAAANVVAAIAALRAANAAKLNAIATRRMFEFTHRPAIGPSWKLRETGKDGLMVICTLNEQSGVATAITSVTLRVESHLFDEEVEPFTYRGRRLIRREIAGFFSYVVINETGVPGFARSAMSIPTTVPAFQGKVRYTFSADHSGSVQETWDAEVVISCAVDATRHEYSVSPMGASCVERQEPDPDNWYQRLKQWLERTPWRGNIE